MDGWKEGGWMDGRRKEGKKGREQGGKEIRKKHWERERERKRLIYYMELAHAIMEPEKSKICGVGGLA